MISCPENYVTSTVNMEKSKFGADLPNASNQAWCCVTRFLDMSLKLILKENGGNEEGGSNVFTLCEDQTLLNGVVRLRSGALEANSGRLSPDNLLTHPLCFPPLTDRIAEETTFIKFINEEVVSIVHREGKRFEYL
jgi:hypothetical protein